jgi:arabinofuranosyltransferase
MPDHHRERSRAADRMKRRTLTVFLHLAPLLLLIGGSVWQVGFGYFDHDLSGHAFGADDAFISYRYASNLVSGDGLAFNPGERVEGYSNLLYVLLVAAGLVFLPDDQAYGFSVCLNLLLVALTYLALLWIARRTLRGHGPLAAVALFSLTPSVWIWTGSGMETPLVLLLVVLTWGTLELALETRSRRAGWALAVLAAVSVLSRADGFLVPLLAAGFCLLRGRRRLALGIGAAAALTLALLVAWRLGYYGYPLPNTYYVKVSGDLSDRISSGLSALWQVGTQQGLVVHVVILACCVVWVLRQQGRHAFGRLPFEACFGIAWICYFVYLGGDVLFDRFLVPIFPLGILLALRWSEEWTGNRLATTRLLFVVVALGAAQLTPLLVDPRMHYQTAKYDRWTTLGRHLRERHPDAVLAIDAAGKVPFFSGLRTIDMLGLNDEHIAHLDARSTFRVGHNKFDPDYVLGRTPDLIAAWMRSNLDLYWGIDRARYRRGGYRIRYLCSTHPTPPGPAIVDVSGFKVAAIRKLRWRGYAYAVLERQP